MVKNRLAKRMQNPSFVFTAQDIAYKAILPHASFTVMAQNIPYKAVWRPASQEASGHLPAREGGE